ncbi:MAG: NADH:flavin oxidoreductase [Deltaproteobacteria bacterium]|nr:NADH:flavin oxidoreductase [Deltaproteobacteria bacterium]MBW2219873.1 NADH:flavin oxidoreductase [Deltaproteobacteria bacterium]
MSLLFKPFNIGSLTLNNRFIHSATHEAMAGDNAKVNNDIVRRYATLAKGEIGLIIPGHLFVHPLGKAHKGQCGIHSDEMISGLSQLADTIHQHGSKVAFQLAHGGRQADKAIINHAPLAPSKWGRDPATLNKPHQMTEEEIKETIAAFVKSAERAVRAGADAIQLHAAHGYLMSEFLSPFFNRRKDIWGGSDENRFRFIKEVITNIKELLPDDMPILVKMNGNDFTPKKGMTPDLAARYAKWMVELGVDAIETSCGTAYSFHIIRGDIPADELMAGLPLWMKPIGKIKLKAMAKTNIFEDAYNRMAGKVVKGMMGNASLILVGGLRKLSQMEEIIEKGDADLISMSRPFIREPFLVKKFKEGKLTQASCINCNKCFAAMFNAKPVRCYQKGMVRL